jgi:hypothetical protein
MTLAHLQSVSLRRNGSESSVLDCRDNRAHCQSERSSHEPLATLRRVSTWGSGSHRDSNPGQATSTTFEQASLLWPSTYHSAPCLPTVFQVGTPLGFWRLQSVSLSGSCRRLITASCPSCCSSRANTEVFLVGQLQGFQHPENPYPARFAVTRCGRPMLS